jgi:hypothetical protein
MVQSGDAIANASLLNVVNTNLVNSYGELLALSSLLMNSVNQFDLRSLDFFASSSIRCAICGGTTLGSLSVLNNGTASISNALSAHATSGGNAADSASGTADILGGDAYAAGNVINFANNNLVDSKYLFMTYNNFGDWGGDIVFPNAETLMKILLSGASISPSNLSLSNTGFADVDNNVSTTATSGNNSFTGGTSTVSSGSSDATTNILNLLNSNLVGGASMNVLLNIEGSWSGSIIGLPPGVEWKKTDHGIALSFDSIEGSDDATDSPDTDVSNGATTGIGNSIDVSAASGDNHASGADGSVESGDAYAAANVINVANTNMIGRNMFWAIINIFGDWSGDVSFGKPDLWIGGHADITGPSVSPGGEVTYHFTVINNGDLPATGVSVHTDLGSDYLKDEGTDASTILTDLGTIAPKESKSFDITARLDRSMAGKETAITSAKVTSIEHDNNLDDNTEDISVLLGSPRHHGSSRPKTEEATSTASTTPLLDVSASFDGPSIVPASSTVAYHVVIKNDGDAPVYNAEFHERLLDGTGASLHGEVWDLGTIAPHDELNIDYSVFYDPDTPSGVYTASGFVQGTAGEDAASAPVASNVSAVSLMVRGLHLVPAPGKAPLVTKPTISTQGTSSSSTAETAASAAPSDEPQNPIPPANDRGLLASVFFSAPSAGELTGFSLALLAAAVGIMLYRRRQYA